MRCREFRTSIPRAVAGWRDVPGWCDPNVEISDADQDAIDAWNDHEDSCRPCAQAALRACLIARGVDPDAGPCACIVDRLSRTCEVCPDPLACPKTFFVRVPKTGSYGIALHDDIRSPVRRIVKVAYCPWCGVRLDPPPKDRRGPRRTRSGRPPR